MATRAISPSSTVRGAFAGAAAGLLACSAGAGYFLDNASIPGIRWSVVAAVFVTQLVLTGAVLGALVSEAKAMLDRRIGRRTAWAPPLAASVATALAAAPSAAFGASYFGALRAPFMGTAPIFSIVSVIAVALAAALAWLDQVEDSSPERPSGARVVWVTRLTSAPRLRRAALAALGLALPIVGIGGALAAAAPDEEILQAFQSASPALLGGICGAGVGVVFGLYAGLVVGAVRRLAARGATNEPRTRVEVEAEADPLAEEEAEIEARFAELDRLEEARSQHSPPRVS